MKILITGGSGYIGRKFVQQFSDEYALTVIDRNPVEAAAFISGDIRDQSLDLSGFDVILHLAAISHPSLVEKDRALAWDVNVNGTMNIAKNLNKNQRLIFMSSAHVYDRESNKKHQEDETPSPSNFYGLTKLVGEEIVKFHSKYNGFDNVILRLFNVYSADQKPGLLVGDVMEKYRSDNTIEIRDPDSFLDMVHIDDLMTLLKGSLSFEQGTYNICSGHPISVKHIYSKIKEYVGSSDKSMTTISNKKSYLLGNNEKISSLGYNFREFSLR